ncbi:DUF1365 domain-containing protein [Yasminevirus sp. GU-2018]|uniref:DUF1365 domain-containing protein n=1 Tax=Yasminevirus sp. GU-2018 TaxID=2420051 RepID=A0A5K0U9Q7_9VIRU|nr:DUF1365 domain-containing protein [Yasminevirus sp. GU-2018]
MLSFYNISSVTPYVYLLILGGVLGLLSVVFLTLLNVVPGLTKNFIGTVLHSRRKNGDVDKMFKFVYDISMDMVDLDTPPTKRYQFLPSFVSYDRSRYIKGDESLKMTVLNRLGEKVNIASNSYKVYLLTNLSVLGHTFNPISVYYVLENNVLINIVAEVSNIPWYEKTTYILNIKDDKITNKVHEKKMHVSPFNPHKDQLYEFDNNVKFVTTNEGANVLNAVYFSIKVYNKTVEPSNLVMHASYNLSRSDFKLLRIFRPLLTIFRIHFQALKLWLKGYVVYEHPLKQNKKSVEVENYIKSTE